MSKKRGKKYLKAIKDYQKDKFYNPEEALDLVKKLHWANFEESIDIAIKLGIDTRRSEEQVRGAVDLPHGTGKKVKVIVFAEGEKAKEAEEAGADFVGSEELAEKIQKGWTDFDATIATPDMMKIVGKLGKVLGPRGLMPNPKVGTVTFSELKTLPSIKPDLTFKSILFFLKYSFNNLAGATPSSPEKAIAVQPIRSLVRSSTFSSSLAFSIKVFLTILNSTFFSLNSFLRLLI